MTGNQLRRESRTDDYEIRPYREGDRKSFLALYGTVYSTKSGTWFDWRYAAPYLDHTPLFVAVVDGTVAGAQAFLPFRLRAGDEETLALQPADAMVHPDHRRQGLFTRINEAALSFYADREPTHFFNFPTAAAEPGLRKLGWRAVGRIPTWYRVHDPEPLLAAAADGPGRSPAVSLAGHLARPLVGLYHRTGSLHAEQPAPVRVERVDGVPAELLANLADHGADGSIAVRHDEAFYRWRFANPRWASVDTYLARDDRRDRPVAAIIAVTHRTLGMTMTKLLDAQPVGDPSLTGEFAALVDAVVDDAANSDVVAVAEGTLPDAALRGRGFRSDERLPLSLASTPTDLIARPIADANEGWSLGGRSLTDIEAWSLTFADQDTPF